MSVLNSKPYRQHENTRTLALCEMLKNDSFTVNAVVQRQEPDRPTLLTLPRHSLDLCKPCRISNYKSQSPALCLSNGVSVLPSASARNLGFIFDSNLTLADQISPVSRSCFYHIRDLRRIRPVLDFTTAQSIGTSFVHSRLDYCNSLYYGLPKFN